MMWEQGFEGPIYIPYISIPVISCQSLITLSLRASPAPVQWDSDCGILPNTSDFPAMQVVDILLVGHTRW